MISDKLKGFIEKTDHAYVASADQRSRPHLAATRGLKVPDPRHIVLDAWFCRKTLENLAEVPRLALAVVEPGSGMGYQLECLVERVSESGFLGGVSPGQLSPDLHQVRSHLLLRVEEILEFSQGAHSDRPLGVEA